MKWKSQPQCFAGPEAGFYSRFELGATLILCQMTLAWVNLGVAKPLLTLPLPRLIPNFHKEMKSFGQKFQLTITE